MKKNLPDQDRRKSLRFRTLLLVKHASKSNAFTFQVANIQNISRGGLAFFAEQEIKEGSVLQLYVWPTKCKKPVEIQGKVVWCPPDIKKGKISEVGIQFLDLSEEAKLAIQGLEASFLANQTEE